MHLVDVGQLLWVDDGIEDGDVADAANKAILMVSVHANLHASLSLDSARGSALYKQLAILE